MTAAQLVQNIGTALIDPLIRLLIAVGVLVFLWGVAEFIINSDDEAKRSEGKQHIIWGLIGITVMIGAIAVLNIVLNTFGVPPPSAG